jgi:Asp-tRNA(Asn)/Glu-tRNA(Gln) amidotransferase A subunit family amidase
VLGRAARRDEIEAVNWTTLETGRAASGVDYARAREAIHGASRELGRFLEKYDLILSPTMALVPAKLGVLSLSQDTAAFTGPATRASGFTSLFNITGQPAMSVPLHWTAPLEGRSDARRGLVGGAHPIGRVPRRGSVFRARPGGSRRP